MVTYDFTCPGLDCGRTQEVTFKNLAEAEARRHTVCCPHCARVMFREIPCPGVVLKGFGWTRSNSWIEGENRDPGS